MSIKKGTPGKGGGSRPDTFSYCPVGHGLKGGFAAWLAGEAYWAQEAHEHTDRDPGTKPCLHWITDGGLRCRRCGSGKPTKCIGWVPLYREEDHKPIVVIVHESASDLLADCSFGDAVLVGRVDNKSSVFVRKATTQTRMNSAKEARTRPVDIVPDLLQMWNVPELNEWARGRREPAAAATDVPLPIRQRLSVPPPASKVEALAIDAEKKAGDGGSVFGGDVGDVLKNIARRVEKNGKHKPTSEGDT